jgi:hypothetical protein
MLIFSMIIMAGFLFFLQSLFMPLSAVAYTSLISASDFTGIQTDVSTAVAGVISIALIILGAALLMGALRR